MPSTTSQLWDRSASLTIVLLTFMWVLLWGDLSWGNLWPASCWRWRSPGRCRCRAARGGAHPPTDRVRPARRLFIWDVIVAAFQIVTVILTGRTRARPSFACPPAHSMAS